jgi:hypothetical protein
MNNNDYPFFTEHNVINEKYLSHYQKWLKNKNLGSVSKTGKLIANLEDKHNIVVDYRTLNKLLNMDLY